MTNLVCARPVQGRTLRVTMLDECGNPEYGDCAYAVSNGYVSATLTPNVEEGERFLQRAADGSAVVNQMGDPLLNWYDVSIVFQEVDPELFSLLTGLSTYEDDQGNTIGVVVQESTFASANFALEVWMGNAEEECPDTGQPLPYYGYNLLPWMIQGQLAEDVAIANDLITFTVTGRTRKGTPWGTGPYDVVLDMNGDPSALFTDIPTDTHYLPLWTQLAPPEAVCGCQSLSS